MALTGGLTPTLDADARGVTLFEEGGWMVLRYAGLYANDATGRKLPALLELTPGGGAILVNDTDAVYPLTIDPWIQQQKLTAADGAASDNFGWSVALDGDTAVVGAKGDDDGGSNSGSAYVFLRTGSTWAQQAKLTVFNGPLEAGSFGWSVAVEGETAVAGANNANGGGGSSSGSAYVFLRTGSTWAQQAKLTVFNGPLEAGSFGWSVAVEGETAVAGANNANGGGGSSSGSAYVFTGPITVTLSDPAGLAESAGFGFDKGPTDGLTLSEVLQLVLGANPTNAATLLESLGLVVGVGPVNSVALAEAPAARREHRACRRLGAGRGRPILLGRPAGGRGCSARGPWAGRGLRPCGQRGTGEGRAVWPGAPHWRMWRVCSK